jgi:hypothetical protein
MHSRRDRLDARLDILDPLVLDGDALARSTGAAPAEFVDHRYLGCCDDS